MLGINIGLAWVTSQILRYRGNAKPLAGGGVDCLPPTLRENRAKSGAPFFVVVEAKNTAGPSTAPSLSLRLRSG